MAKPLTPKQLKFVAFYLATGNATQSYIDAGYKGRGRSAENAASQLLGNVGVKEAIATARKQGTEKAGITAEWFAERVKLEAEREDEEASHSARVAALKLAGQMLGLLSEKHQHEHSGPGGSAIQVKGKYDCRFSLTGSDVAAAELLAPMAGGHLHPDGGPQPLSAAIAASEAAAISAAL